MLIKEAASLLPATSIRARMPGFWRFDITFRPWVASARLNPVSAVTSQMAPQRRQVEPLHQVRTRVILEQPPDLGLAVEPRP